MTVIPKKPYGSTQPYELLRFSEKSDAIVSYGKDTRLIFPGFTVVDYIESSVKWPCQLVINHIATEPMRIEKRARNNGYDRVALPHSVSGFLGFIDQLTEQLHRHMDLWKPQNDNIAQFV